MLILRKAPIFISIKLLDFVFLNYLKVFLGLRAGISLGMLITWLANRKMLITYLTWTAEHIYNIYIYCIHVAYTYLALPVQTGKVHTAERYARERHCTKGSITKSSGSTHLQVHYPPIPNILLINV